MPSQSLDWLTHVCSLRHLRSSGKPISVVGTAQQHGQRAALQALQQYLHHCRAKLPRAKRHPLIRTTTTRYLNQIQPCSHSSLTPTTQHAPSERETAIIDRLHRIFRQLDGAYRRAQSGLTRVTPTIKITPEHFILRFEIRRGSYLHGFNNVSTAAIWAVARCHKAVPLSLDINFEHDTFRPAPTRIHATPSKADAEAHISVTIQNATPGQPLTVEFQCSRDPSDAMVDYMLDTMGVAMMGASMLPSRRLHHAYSSEMDAAARQMFKEMQAIIDELFGSPVRSPPRRSHPSDNEPSSTPFADNDALSGSSVARDEAMQRPGTVKHNSGPWPYDSPQGKLLLQKLQRMGAHVYLPERGDDKATEEHGTSRCDWDKLAGYDSQKQVIEDTVLLALQRPEVYAQVAAGTRGKEGASLRPRGVLFEGPPGCGKTTSARFVGCTWPCRVCAPLATG